MGSVRVLFGMFCLAAVCSGGLSGSDTVVNKALNGPKIERLKIDNCGRTYGRVIGIARQEIGVLEKGCGNCGADVAGYLAYVGVKTPAPWCAAWVSWCYGKAGYSQPRTAWSPALFPEERVVAEPAAGLTFGIYYPALNRIGHCGIVERMQGDMLQTIEGNTSVGGSREGVGVFRRMRHRRAIAKYADWIRPIPP